MSLPVTYRGEIVIPGTVRELGALLHPRRWSESVPEIWLNSYLVGPREGSPGTLPFASRSETPKSGREHDDKWELPGLFFEDVETVGFRYRNVLETRRRASEDSVLFEYWQYECLNTTSGVGTDDGGIDVDHGFTEVAKTEIPGMVKVTFEKTVRFTEPAFVEIETNALAHVLVPLTFDAWLHELLFLEPADAQGSLTPPEDEKTRRRT